MNVSKEAHTLFILEARLRNKISYIETYVKGKILFHIHIPIHILI